MVRRVGSVRVIREERKIIIEWKIDDFLRLGSDEGYFSPNLDLSGASGFLLICPCGQERDAPFEDTDIGLVFRSMPEHCANATATLGLKTADGGSYSENTAIFYETQKTFYIRSFICRSDLMKWQSELLPSGNLTVICTLKDSGPNAVSVDDVQIPSVSAERQFLEASSQTEEGAGRMFQDASAQTEDVTEHEVLDASAQTNKGTGVWELQKDLHEISLSGDISDVILKVADREFKAHRCILAARSPVFRAMMSNEMKENLDGVVDIPDVDPKTFSDFLNYLYTGSTENLTAENAAKLYTAADKYQVEVLKENCLDHMLRNVSVENFCEVLILSIQHNEEELKEMCIQYFGKHLLDIIQTCKWQTFLTENPIVANELHIKHIQLNKDIYALLMAPILN